MHRISYETRLGRIVLVCENSSEEMVSFDGCFDMPCIGDGHIRLPGAFRVRGSKVFCSKKIANPGNIVHSVECTGGVTYADLRRHVPSIFDMQFINKTNSDWYLRENLGLIVDIASEVLDRDEVLSILKK